MFLSRSGGRGRGGGSGFGVLLGNAAERGVLELLEVDLVTNKRPDVGDSVTDHRRSILIAFF